MFCFSSGQPIHLGRFVSSTMIGENEIVQSFGSINELKFYRMCKLVPNNMLCENFFTSVSVQCRDNFNKILIHLVCLRNQFEFNPEIIATIECIFNDSLTITKFIPVGILLKAGDLIGVTTSHYDVDLFDFVVSATVC